MTAARAGELIAGRYRLEEPLGEGATGIVWRAVQLELDRPVALKLLRPHLVEDGRARGRFEREARVASRLDHPSAVRIHDFGEDGAHVFLAMELVVGQTLRRVLVEEAVERSERLELACQIADVLASAHRVPLVHRDLKPENVFVQRLPAGPRARVVDFGLAFVAGDGAAGRMTLEGVVAGTPQYLSPEQARGEGVGPPTDVYALGCLLYEMIAGHVPFRGNDADVLARQMYAPAPALRGEAETAAVPTRLAELVGHMLRKRPEERPTAADVRDALAAIDGAVRERARDDGYLRGRVARMVPAPRPREGAPLEDAVEVAVIGGVSAEVLLGLAVNGVAAFVVSDEQPLGAARAVYAPGATVAEVAELAAGAAPVVTDVRGGDVERLTALVRAGAAEVVPSPATAADIARRLLRAVRRHERRATP